MSLNWNEHQLAEYLKQFCPTLRRYRLARREENRTELIFLPDTCTTPAAIKEELKGRRSKLYVVPQVLRYIHLLVSNC